MLQFNKFNLKSLIDLEKNIEGLTRNSWNHNFEISINEATAFDVCIKDVKNKKLIVFHQLLKDSCSRMTPSRQLLRHWLLGEKFSERSKYYSYDEFLTENEINLFFNGTKNDIIEYKKSYEPLSAANSESTTEPSLDWNILHFPANHLLNNLEIEDIKNIYLGTEVDNNFTIWIVFGIVSQSSHIKSDKQKILDITKEFLAKKKFDLDKEIESKDIDRNGEPIILWMSKSKYKDADFYPLLGVNFGYDNGLSGYRLGFGIYLKEDQTGFYNFSRKMFITFDSNVDIDPIFKTWIHHKNYGKVEEMFEQFLRESYETVFYNIKRMIDLAKNFKYNNYEASERVMLSYHRSQLLDYQDSLTKAHNDFSKKYGLNHYTHFLSWSYIADNVMNNNDNIKLANLIARNILVLKK